MTTMMDENSALLRAHRNNISRYRRLLRTDLTELERRFIEKRLSEEQTAIEKVAASTFPDGFKISRQASVERFLPTLRRAAPALKPHHRTALPAPLLSCRRLQRIQKIDHWRRFQRIGPLTVEALKGAGWLATGLKL